MADDEPNQGESRRGHEAGQPQRDDTVVESVPSRTGGSRGYYSLGQQLDDVVKEQMTNLAAALRILQPASSPAASLPIIETAEIKNGGNKERTKKLVGRDQLLMAIYLVAYPDAKLDEIAAFIANNGGELYSRSTISRRRMEMKNSRKVADSVEAYQAFDLPANILQKERFVTLPPPLGVHGLARRSLVDAGERVIYLEQKKIVHRRRRRRTGLLPAAAHTTTTTTTIRVRKPGQEYHGKGQKLTVIYFIEPGDPALPAPVAGSIANPRRWFKLFEDEDGTTAEEFAGSVDTVLTSMDGSGLNVDHCHRTLLWDHNVRSHSAPIVTQTVYVRRPSKSLFCCVPRPPDMPKYGPIEYAFAELGRRLQQQRVEQPNWNVAILRQVVTNILNELGRNGGFDALFAHCGY
jgi:hypothetical protein